MEDITLYVVDFGWEDDVPYVDLSLDCSRYSQTDLMTMTYETFSKDLHTRPDWLECSGKRVRGRVRQTGEGLEM